MCTCLTHNKHYVLAVIRGEEKDTDHCCCGPREGDWAGMGSLAATGERAAAWQVQTQWLYPGQGEAREQ